MYDTIIDKKCEMVNITVSQRVRNTNEEMVMKMECKVINETVSAPNCVTVLDKEVEEVNIWANFTNNMFSSSLQTCEDIIPTGQSFQPSCTNVYRPLFTKDCREVLDETCEVIIEHTVEQQCKEVEQTEYEEQCSTSYEQVCETVQQYQCQEEEYLYSDVVPISSSCGHPSTSLPASNSLHAKTVLLHRSLY